MRTRLRSLSLLTAVFAAQLVAAAGPLDRRASPTPIGPAFVRNAGQADPAARFVSVGGGQPVFFTQHDVRIVDTHQQRSLWLMFVDGDAQTVEGDSPTGGRVTLLRRVTSASFPMYRDVVYRNIWPGIDARVSAAATGIKYEFDIAPGADPRKIHLRYGGADRIALTPAGELRLSTGDTTIVDTRPVASQEIDGLAVPVEVRFVQRNADVTFALGRYDRTRRLVIDPTLVYSTYLGSSGNDVGRAIAVDSTGAASIAGSSNYFDLPVTPGAYQTRWHGDPNTVIPAFVAKINPAGTHFNYVTFSSHAGDTSLTPAAIAVDASNIAFAAGTDLGSARVDRIDPAGVNNATFVISGTHSNVGSPTVMPTSIAAAYGRPTP